MKSGMVEMSQNMDQKMKDFEKKFDDSLRPSFWKGYSRYSSQKSIPRIVNKFEKPKLKSELINRRAIHFAERDQEMDQKNDNLEYKISQMERDRNQMERDKKYEIDQLRREMRYKILNINVYYFVK